MAASDGEERESSALDDSGVRRLAGGMPEKGHSIFVHRVKPELSTLREMNHRMKFKGVLRFNSNKYSSGLKGCDIQVRTLTCCGLTTSNEVPWTQSGK